MFVSLNISLLKFLGVDFIDWNINETITFSQYPDDIYCVYNKNNGNHYQMNYDEYSFLELLKKNYDKNKICTELGYTEENFDIYINQLDELSFFSNKKKRLQKWNKLYLFCVDTRKLKKTPFTALFEKILYVLSYLSGLSLLFTVLITNHALLFSVFSIRLEMIGYLALTFFLIHLCTTIIHELAHGIFAINRNIMVPEFGLIIYYFSLAGFTDISEIYFLKNTKDKILCLISGLMVNFVLMTSALIIYLFISPNMIAQGLFLSNLVTLFFNLGFFIKLDGYYILQILLDEPYLREKSINFIFKKINQKKIPTKKESAIYCIVGIISIIFIPIMIITTVLSFFS